MFIDAHTHLSEYKDNLNKALNQIQTHKIFSLSVSMDVSSYQETKQIAQQSEFVIPCFGIHPWEAHRFSNDVHALSPYIQESPIIGEVGLDFYFVKERSKHKAQQKVLEYFFNSASSGSKILNLHTKGAESEVLALLEEFKLPHSIIHWYSGPISLIERYLSAGCFFTMGSALLHSKHIKNILDAIPDERLLTETDNPGGTKWMTGHRGYPDQIRRIVQEIGKQKNMTEKEVNSLVENNFASLISDVPEVRRKWKALRSE